MKNYIIKCSDSIENERVQIKILGKGHKWSEGCLTTQYINKPILIFDNLNNKERAISYHSKEMSEDYKQHSCYKKHLRISANDFLKLKKF